MFHLYLATEVPVLVVAPSRRVELDGEARAERDQSLAAALGGVVSRFYFIF